jgi:Cytochrome P460
MATQIKIGLFVMVAGIVLVGALAVRRTEGAKDEFRFDASTLKDRTAWIQVNAEPYHMGPAVAALCAPVSADMISPKTRNPHAASYITVYVNNAGREAMFAKTAQRFPEGSIIVKEKFGAPSDDRKPLLYTIMRKREAGYNPQVGDWEFSIVGPDGKELKETGKLENCQGCHVGQSESDFVYRPYVKLQ